MRRAEPFRLDRALPGHEAMSPLPRSPAFTPQGRPAYVPADPSGDAPVSVVTGEVPSAPPSAGRELFRATEVADTTAFPARTHGKVFFSLGSADYVCSGTVVAAAADGVAFTAGHCVNDPGVGWAANWAFVPGYRNGTAPFGVFAAKNLWASSAWIQAENRNYDLGAAVLATNGSGQTAEAAVGARGIAFNQDKYQHYTSWGYPAAPPFTGGLLYTCTSDWVMDDPYPTDAAPPMGINCDMTGGSSGGAWVIGDQYVNSVNSFGYSSYPGIMFGPYFGEVARSLYLAVCGCESEWDTTPPETTITSGPSGVTNDTTPTFGFSSSEAGSSFECRLDSGAFQGGCSSPKTFGPLADGSHSFEVRATDSASNIDPTPALRNFTVDTSPPDTAVSGSASAKGTQRQEGNKIVVKAKVKAGEDLRGRDRQGQAQEEDVRARGSVQVGRRRGAGSPEVDADESKGYRGDSQGAESRQGGNGQADGGSQRCGRQQRDRKAFSDAEVLK